MPGATSTLEIFPELSRASLQDFRTSAWYSRFQRVTLKTTVIPLDDEFRRYMDTDGITIPIGADDKLPETTLSDDEDQADDEDDEPAEQFAFPDLDKRIREVITAYDGAVFPKLNWSAPKDARWISPSPPLRCLSPADVYLLLKSSDFVSHDVDPEQAYDGCIGDDGSSHPLELVLKKYYVMQESREVRCFVRRGILIAISQRDPNYYDFWNDKATQDKIRQAVIDFFEKNIQQYWQGPPDYAVDLLLTRDMERAHILDFNPYAPRAMDKQDCGLPILRAIDSRTHPSVVRSSPAYAHNMVPFDMIQASAGQDLESFTAAWSEEIHRSMADE